MLGEMPSKRMLSKKISASSVTKMLMVLTAISSVSKSSAVKVKCSHSSPRVTKAVWWKSRLPSLPRLVICNEIFPLPLASNEMAVALRKS